MLKHNLNRFKIHLLKNKKIYILGWINYVGLNSFINKDASKTFYIL